MVVFKILYKLSFMPDGILDPCSFHRSDHLNHVLTLTVYVGTTNWLLFSAIPSMINLRNSLPFNPASYSSVTHFVIVLNQIV